MNGGNIKLYPSNWLYNAGVVGFLWSVEEIEKISVLNMLNSDGSVEIPNNLFRNLKVQERYFGNNKISSIVGKSNLYRNFLQPTQKDLFVKFVGFLERVEPDYCDFCGNGYSLDNNDELCLNEIDPDRSKFLYRIRKFSIVHNTLIGPSIGEFPNAFWGLNESSRMCHLCGGFIIIHHHLALTPLPDGSEIFINAPSFKVMYYLNKYVQSLPKDGKKIKHLLGMSLIEFSTKLKAQLGLWASMNIEVVIKYKYKKEANKYEDKIDFFSLPAEIVSLLNDHEISSLIYQIGEFKVLDIMLDGKFNKLIEDAYRFMKILMKDQRSEADKEFLNEYFKKNRKDEERKNAVQNMLKLYALIKEKIRRSSLWQARI
jgi:CRISPR-associated protein Cst1